MNLHKVLFSFIKIAFSVLIILLIIFGTVRLCETGYDYGYRFFAEISVDPAPGKDVIVHIESGASAMEISRKLEEKGLVKDASLFYLQLKLSAYSKSIEPGTYTLNTSMTPKELMIAMSPGMWETESTESTETAGE